MKRYTFEELRAFVGRADTEEKVETAREFIAKLPYLTKGERDCLNTLLDEALFPYDEDPYAEAYDERGYHDYGPSNPWDAPGMKVSDFIRGVRC